MSAGYSFFFFLDFGLNVDSFNTIVALTLKNANCQVTGIHGLLNKVLKYRETDIFWVPLIAIDSFENF